MKIVITNGTIMFNRGSEAVIRSVTHICRFWFPKAEIVIVSGFYGEILKTINDADRIVPRTDEEGHFKYLIAEVKNADIVLVTGADNYDYPRNVVNMRPVNDTILANTKAKTVLFDCSLSDINMNEEVFDDIRRFCLITVRETESEKVFQKWFPKEKILLYPDPAFIMPTEECSLPFGFELNNTVGINISNLIMGKRVGAPEEIVLPNYFKVIDYLLENTTKKILFIQHVINNGYDLEAINKLFGKYIDNPRVSVMQTELLNAMQVKYIISKLDLLITARTHAAIAAFSTNVPTLIVGYSIKSIGITKDIFGNHSDYVVSVGNLNDDDNILQKLKIVIKNEDKIKKILENKMPIYKMEALKFGECIMSFIEEDGECVE